jgi:hypothetical protein
MERRHGCEASYDRDLECESPILSLKLKYWRPHNNINVALSQRSVATSASKLEYRCDSSTPIYTLRGIDFKNALALALELEE